MSNNELIWTSPALLSISMSWPASMIRLRVGDSNLFQKHSHPFCNHFKPDYLSGLSGSGRTMAEGKEMKGSKNGNGWMNCLISDSQIHNHKSQVPQKLQTNLSELHPRKHCRHHLNEYMSVMISIIPDYMCISLILIFCLFEILPPNKLTEVKFFFFCSFTSLITADCNTVEKSIRKTRKPFGYWICL
jgi:hypothetical protein